MAQKRVGPLLALRLDPGIIAEIERIAEKRQMNKSQVARMVLKAGLEMHQDLEKVGVIAMLDVGTALYKRFKESERKGELKEGLVTE